MAKVYKFRGKPWKRRLMVDQRVREKRDSRRSVAVVGAERLQSLVMEIGEDEGLKRGWRRRVSAQLGLSYSVVCKLAQGTYERVGTKTIDAVCKSTGCSVGDLLDDAV